MTEYIERDAVHRMMVGLQGYIWKNPTTGEIRDTVSSDDVNFGVDKIPAADVEPVRHGWWQTLTGNPTPRCTSCHKEAVKLWHGGWHTPDYCPNCGVKMDGKVKEHR